MTVIHQCHLHINFAEMQSVKCAFCGTQHCSAQTLTHPTVKPHNDTQPNHATKAIHPSNSSHSNTIHTAETAPISLMRSTMPIVTSGRHGALGNAVFVNKGPLSPKVSVLRRTNQPLTPCTPRSRCVCPFHHPCIAVSCRMVSKWVNLCAANGRNRRPSAAQLPFALPLLSFCVFLGQNRTDSVVFACIRGV